MNRYQLTYKDGSKRTIEASSFEAAERQAYRKIDWTFPVVGIQLIDDVDTRALAIAAYRAIAH